jgi:hypothetical protein
MRLPIWLSTLLPTFAKSRVLDDIVSTRKELATNTVPGLKNAALTYSKHKFKDAWVQGIEQKFSTRYKARYKGSFITPLSEIAENSLRILEIAEKLVSTKFEQDIVRDAMRLLTANTIQLVEAIEFFAQYSLRLTLVATNLEVIATSQYADIASADGPTAGEMKWLEANFNSFMAAVDTLSMEPEDVERKLDGIPDVVISPDTAGRVEATMDFAKTDPLRLNLISARFNLIYRARLAVAEWQETRLQAAIETKRLLEFRLLQLQHAADGKEDARLQRQIEYTQERLEKIKYKLMKEGMDYGTV